LKTAGFPAFRDKRRENAWVREKKRHRQKIKTHKRKKHRRKMRAERRRLGK
jgi:hypothetical protein